MVPHPVHVERGLRIGDEDVGRQPFVEQAAGRRVAVEAGLVLRQVEAHDVVRAAVSEALALLGADDVYGGATTWSRLTASGS